MIINPSAVQLLGVLTPQLVATKMSPINCLIKSFPRHNFLSSPVKKVHENGFRVSLGLTYPAYIIIIISSAQLRSSKPSLAKK
jgi:hypothetical protein